MHDVNGAGAGADGGIASPTLKGILLVLVQALPVMAVVSLFPAMPKLMQQFTDAPDAAFLVPMIVTMPSFCIALLGPVAGWLVDRLGRRIVLNAALFIYAVTGLAPLVLDNLAAIVASRALLGAAEAAIITVCGALIADYFGEQRYRWLAIQGAVASVVGTTLIAVGGVLADIDWRAPFSIYAIAIPLFLIALLVIEEPRNRAASVKEEGSSGGFPWKIGLTIGVVSFIASALHYVEPLHISSLFNERGIGSITQAGMIQALTSIGYICGSLLFRRMSKLVIGTQLAISGSLIGIGMIGIGLSTSYQAAGWWALAQQLGAGMIIPTLIAWTQASLPFAHRGRGMGIWATFFFSGQFFCPTLVVLTTRLLGSLSATFWILGVVTACFALLGLALQHQARRVRVA